MEHLTMDEVKKAILRYVEEDSYNYALLIDGEWGCGKTYFIKNTVIPEIEKIKIETPGQKNSETENGEEPKTKTEEPKTKKVIYVSLYGVKSTDDISQQILQVVVEKNLKLKGKWLPGIKHTAELAEIFFSRNGSTKKIEEIASFLITDWDKYVLIFDDLERTHLPINEVFGFINQFVEQNGAKVILIANQKEIGSALMQKDLEQKYLVCLNENIKYPNLDDRIQEDFNALFTNGNKQRAEEPKPAIVKLEDLKKRLDYVFGESDQYTKIKEKLIGRTIYFKPDLEDLVSQITSNVKDDTARKLIKKMIPKIVSIMQQESHYNLRTYQFTLVFLEKLILEMSATGIDLNEDNLTSILVIATLKVAIAFKNGEKNFEWSYSAEYGKIVRRSKRSLGDSFISFKFIHDYIYYSTFETNTILKAIKGYVEDKELESRHEDSAFNKLQVYWTMKDEEVKEQLKIMQHEVNIEEDYYIERYILILSDLYQLREIGIEIDINSYVDSMVKTIQKHGSFPQSRIQPNIQEDDKWYRDFRKNIDRLDEAIKQAREKDYGDQLNRLLENKEKWGEQFYTYCVRNKTDIYIFGKLLPLLNIEVLLDRISTGSPRNLDDFRLCLIELYSHADFIDHYRDEEETLKLLHDKVENMSSDSRICDLNRKNIVITLNMILDRIRYQKGEN